MQQAQLAHVRQKSVENRVWGVTTLARVKGAAEKPSPRTRPDPGKGSHNGAFERPKKTAASLSWSYAGFEWPP